MRPFKELQLKGTDLVISDLFRFNWVAIILGGLWEKVLLGAHQDEPYLTEQNGIQIQKEIIYLLQEKRLDICIGTKQLKKYLTFPFVHNESDRQPLGFQSSDPKNFYDFSECR